MLYKALVASLVIGQVAAAPTPVEDAKAAKCDCPCRDDAASEFDKLDLVNETSTDAHRRELFPVYALGSKCARRGCSVYHQMSSANRASNAVMVANGGKAPIKALEMLALNDDMNTVVSSDSYCTRRNAMARAAGLAAGLALSTVNAPAFAAATKSVKRGSDSGQLVFVPAELKICKGDTVTWTNNKGGPHNVVFDEDAIPAGVDQAKISMDDQLGEEGATFSKMFDVAGNYDYYCEPHRGAGMLGNLIVE
jgi:plastocyanin